MKILHTQIDINASKDKIWNILTDFEKYPMWNPFVKSLTGRLQIGTSLQAELHQPEGKPMNIKPKVVSLDEGNGFSWLGHLMFTGIFDGHHQFVLEDLGNGTVRFVHKEEFKGLLIPLLWKMLDTKTRKGFESMNEALKKEAEK